MVLAGVLAKDSLILSAYPCVWNCTLNQAVCECVSVCACARSKAFILSKHNIYQVCAERTHLKTNRRSWKNAIAQSLSITSSFTVT